MNKGIFPFVVTSYERDLQGHHIHCSWRLGDEVWARERGHRQMQSCVMDVPGYSMNNSWGVRIMLSLLLWIYSKFNEPNLPPLHQAGILPLIGKMAE